VLVEPLAEAVGDPLLEVLLLALGLDGGPQVGEQRADELDGAELLDDVYSLERVGEELAVPEDPRLAGALEELLLITSCQRSSTSLDLVKKRWPPRSKR
jgi:hypothetical protein